MFFFQYLWTGPLNFHGSRNDLGALGWELLEPIGTAESCNTKKKKKNLIFIMDKTVRSDGLS